MKQNRKLLDFRKTNVIELNTRALLKVIGGNGDIGGTTETGPPIKNLSSLYCDND